MPLFIPLLKRSHHGTIITFNGYQRKQNLLWKGELNIIRVKNITNKAITVNRNQSA